MAEYATLARPYAQAVLSLAKADNTLAQWAEVLSLLSAIAQDEQVSGLLNNPRVERGKLVNLLLDIGGDKLMPEAQNFVRLLGDNRKLAILAEIARQFETLKAAAEGYVQAILVSTYAVKPQQKKEVEDALCKRLGKQVEIETVIDRELMGGWLIRVGDQVIDLSVRGRLQQLAGNLH